MKAVDVYRQERTSFISLLVIQTTIIILAICTLFGLYIWKSFEAVSVMEQTNNGNYSVQEMNR